MIRTFYETEYWVIFVDLLEKDSHGYPKKKASKTNAKSVESTTKCFIMHNIPSDLIAFGNEQWWMVHHLAVLCLHMYAYHSKTLGPYVQYRFITV